MLGLVLFILYEDVGAALEEPAKDLVEHFLPRLAGLQQGGQLTDQATSGQTNLIRITTNER